MGRGNSRIIRLWIDGMKLKVEVDGAKGKECMELTEFLTSADGVKVTDQYLTAEYADREVPVGVEV